MKFSVLMSVYINDKPEFLKEALDSVINQTQQPSEIILVEDGPISDNLEKLIMKYEKEYKFIKVIRKSQNTGLGNALKIGLDNCKYSLVARMDADDISVEDRFEKQLNCFKRDKKLSIVGGYIEEFLGDKSNIIGVREVPLEDKKIKEYMKYRCPLNHTTVMFKKEDVEKSGNYIELHYNEDYYLWIRMFLKKCKFKNLNETLVYTRIGNEMYQRRGGYKYFKSEVGIQKYMLKNGMIGVLKFLYNVLIRFIIQILMTNKLRELTYKYLARKKVK